jgi:predicted Fe-Mo cluster-binding NifX family protein
VRLPEGFLRKSLVTELEEIMKIVVSSTGVDLDSTVDPRFGRAAFLLFVDSDTNTLIEAMDNSQGRDAAQGAGISAAALVADKGVKAILTGRVGPKAMPVVEKAGIQVVSDVSGSVREAVEQFRLDAQEQTSSSSASAAPGKTTNPGSGMAGGRCQGCGSGRGKGGGAGMGRGQGAGKFQTRKK